ncbi:MAG TPA: HAD-IIA family hydrolase [Acidimicrobiales bacterium]|jgi:HAD superfamily hydrolase (TIGR01458 family)|nr:HAD-IIA family hydrolase [Acidimicrobiales bacterium]
MADAVLLDVDGVLTVSWRALPGAIEVMGWLADHQVDYRLVTNTSSRTRREIAVKLGEAGMDVDGSLILTAVSSATRYLVDTYPGRGCLVVNEGDLGEDLEGVEQVDADHAGVVLLGGAGPSVGYEELNRVFGLALSGVPLVALHRNTRFETADGLVLDMGAFLLGLEAAAGVTATVVGKPARAFFEAALDDAGVDPTHAVMVGDDIVSDVLGAQSLGITGVLVRTGKFRPTDLDGDDGRPDHVIDDIGSLPHLLEELAADH